MKSSIEEIIPILGTEMDGGFYAGRIRLDDGEVYALILAPKGEGEHKPTVWKPSNKIIEGATSYNDGLANTNAMMEGGSKPAKWARDLRIGGHDDWYLPSQDELEVIYRNLKPTDERNWCYARSGINLSSPIPNRAYTPDRPAQTKAEAFQAGGEQAFESEWHWSSTRHISNNDWAWFQHFYGGYQGSHDTTSKLRARAVRRLKI